LIIGCQNRHTIGVRIVTAAVIEEDGKILIAKRRAGDRFGRLWEFPGGKLESGESPEQCLERELREELGIDVRVSGFLGSYPFSSPALSLELQVFRACIIGGRPCPREHEEVRWVSPGDLKSFSFTEPDRALVVKLVKNFED